MNENKLKDVIKNTSVEPLNEQTAELNIKRADFFAKTILNAKKVAEHEFDEQLQKYKISKDKVTELERLMTVRGKKENYKDSQQELFL